MAEDEEVQREADKILPKLCEKLASQMLYNQRITSTSTYWANRGVRVRKKDIVGVTAKAEYVMDLEKYMSVSTMSIRFYIHAKLPLHYLEIEYCIFQVVPAWAEDKADAWREVAIQRWLKGDEKFAAVADRNASNRGHGGTHRAGNRSTERYMEKLVCTYIE